MDSLPQLSGRVLVADDEAGICKGVRRVLEPMGLEVEMAHDGPQALEQLRSGSFDVALVDLIMPSFGGMELLSRAAEEELETVLIVITAHASIETVVQAMRLGAFDYLPKPFVPQEVVLRVERALNYRRLSQEAQRLLLEVSTDRTQLRGVVGSLADGVLIVNVDGQVVLSNSAARAMLEHGAAPSRPRPLRELVAEGELLQLIEEAAAQPEGERAALSGRFTRGQSTYMARVVPLETEQGEFLGTATVIRDVTELVSLEQAKAQFMSMVAHELKSPLAAVQGFLKVVLGDRELPAEKMFSLLARSSERLEGMAQLVRDLLELSQADHVPLRRIEPLNLAEILAEALEHNQPAAERAEVSVSSAVPEACPELRADRDDLIRILNNLVSNAVKYNRPGGEVRVLVEPEAEGVWLRVSDNGLGIPPEALPRLGEEFYRVGTPDRKGIVGTGLGLSLVKRTVDSYHGRMEIVSQPGEGSTFSVWLPWG